MTTATPPLIVKEQRLIRSTHIILLSVATISFIFAIRGYQWDIYSRVFTLSSCSLLCLMSSLYIHRGGSREIGAYGGLLAMCIAAGYSSYSSGGLSNPAAHWLILIPLMGAIAGGIRVCAVGAILSFLAGLALFYLESVHGTLPDLTPPAYRYTQERLNQLFQLIVVIVGILGLQQQLTRIDTELVTSIDELSDEVKLRTAAEATAEQSNRAKSQFLANMSHEIRTPMNAIIGLLHLLNKESLSPKQQDFIKTALSSSNSLLVLLNDILDISKIEAGKIDLEVTDFELTELLTDTERSMQVPARDKGLKLSFTNYDTDIFLNGDPTRVRQILLNLIGNAIKFTEQGCINVTTRLQTLESNHVHISLIVEDTGIGIAAEAQEKLFEIFTQADSSTTRLFGGTGLGLAISMQLAKLMDGNIELYSVEGVGSRFCVTLRLAISEVQPKASDAPAPTEIKSTDTPHPTVTPRVLVVDDNEVNTFVACSELEDLPYELSIDTASNGREALETILSSALPYQLVLMDCQMPEMDGYTATKELRKHAQHRHLPIIAMTANAMKGDREKCLAAGMSDYISKPINPDDLAQKVEQWLSLDDSVSRETAD